MSSGTVVFQVHNRSNKTEAVCILPLHFFAYLRSMPPWDDSTNELFFNLLPVQICWYLKLIKKNLGIFNQLHVIGLNIYNKSHQTRIYFFNLEIKVNYCLIFLSQFYKYDVII